MDIHTKKQITCWGIFEWYVIHSDTLMKADQRSYLNSWSGNLTDKFDPERFILETDNNGLVRVWYKSVEIRPYTPVVDGGRGTFFNINNEFFVKTCYGGGYRSQ